MGRRAGFFLPLLYGNTPGAVTNDIVSGDNSVFGVQGYSAAPGWDPCTGLGSPNGAKILAILQGTPASVAAVPATVHPAIQTPLTRRNGSVVIPSTAGPVKLEITICVG